jgi:transcription elongation factor GreA
MDTVPFTEEGYARLSKELDALKRVERPKIISEIAEARAHGDLSENAEYHAAREKQGFVEARIADLEDKISRGKVIKYTDTSEAVRFGAWVTVMDEDSGEEKTYRVVGELEADLEKGLISLSSPIARALLGKKPDDVVAIKVPKGTVEYQIRDVRY